MEIRLSPTIKREVSSALRKYGYGSERDFVEDALRHRILELKKRDFLAETRKLKEALGKRGLSEKDILKDFDEFYHKK